MKTLKKGLSALLVFLLVFGMLAAMPAAVSAAGDDSQPVGTRYGDFEYESEKGSDGKNYAYITAYVGNGSNVTVPKTIKNMPVIAIMDEAFAYHYDLQHLSLPDSLVYIGYSAFSLCENLQELRLPKHLSYLGAAAFYGCTSLKTVTIPDEIEFFGYGSFAACFSLKELKTASNKGFIVSDNGVLYSNDKKVLLAFPCGKSGSVFKVPAAVEEIAPNSFMWNLNLKSLIIQNKCKTIGSYAFAFSNLKEIMVPNSVNNIGDSPFEGMEQFLIRSNKGSYAYQYCNSNEINWGPMPVLVTGVKLNTNSISWPAGRSGSFKATVTPSNARDKGVLWSSSNTKVATVDAKGKLTAVAPGTATITCKAKDGNGAKATCTVKVYQPMKGIKLNVTKLNWPVGKSGSFKATVTPANAANKSLKWTSSNPKAAKVDSKGKLTAVGVGTTTVTCSATDGSGAKATCKVTVYQPVKSVKLNTNAIKWPVGKSGSFKATVTPANAANKGLKWTSSNPKAAKVDSKGKLTAVGVGTTTITCSASDGSGAKATCKVTVYQPVKSVKLNTNAIKWPVGKSGSFKATVTPANAANKGLKWTSSNPKAAKVDSKGKLTAVGVGTTTITCSASDGSGAKATCKVTVYQPVKSVKLNTNAIKWPVGKSGSFKATVTPANAANKGLKWTSSNPKAAKVDSKGKLTAVGVGTTTITCSASDGSGVKATCKVTVYQPVKSVKLNTNAIKWPVGKSGSFKATVTPANAANKGLKWTSSNPKAAKVDSKGKLTAVGVGTTTITCSASDGSGVKATCKVTVYQPVKSVKLNTNAIKWPVGKSGSFKATVTPANAANKGLKWTSSNPKAAKVDSKGKLTAVGVGTTTITCSASDGSGVKATCKVTVYQPVKSVKLNTNSITWPIGKSGSFKATVTPANAANKSLKWTSSNPKAAKVDSKGKLTAVGVGTTTITCSASDGSGAKATCKVTVYDPKEAIYKAGDKITYTAYLSGIGTPVCGVDASVVYDPEKLILEKDGVEFPSLGNTVSNTFEKGEVLFNSTNLEGYDFINQTVLVRASFTVKSAAFTPKDIFLDLRQTVDFNGKDLKGNIKETVTKS